MLLVVSLRIPISSEMVETLRDGGLGHPEEEFVCRSEGSAWSDKGVPSQPLKSAGYRDRLSSVLRVAGVAPRVIANGHSSPRLPDMRGRLSVRMWSSGGTLDVSA